MKKRVLGAMIMTVVLAMGTTAFAQDPVEGEEGGGGDTGMTGDTGGTTNTPPANTGDTGGGDDYTMGIGTTWPTGGDGGHANFLWKLGGENWLDLSIGVDLTKLPDPLDPMADAEVVFGFELGAGYRMYKPMKGRIRPFLEPFLVFGAADVSNFADVMQLTVGAMMGFDYQLMDQFTLGAGIGAAAAFQNKFKEFDIGLFTASINATWWWGK
jgi:hypothetical protein